MWLVSSFLCDPDDKGGGAGRGILPSEVSVIWLQLSQDFILLLQLLIKSRTAA